MILTRALRRITARTFLLAFLGNAALLLLGWLWLHIPDAHPWQFAFTAILGVALLVAFLVLHVRVLRRLDPATQLALWQSALILLGWLLLAHILQHTAGLLSAGVPARAGYWNSQLSAHHRAYWTYVRLVDWQTTAIGIVLWVVIPALLLPFTIETVQRTDHPWSIAFATLRRPQLWLTVALAYLAGSWLSGHIYSWHPLHSVSGEILSVALRSIAIYTLAIALLLITLAIVTELLSCQHSKAGARRNPAL